MIRVENLTKQYGKQKALDALSFDIPKGQVVGFLGPNGAGKSTTMKILTGFLPATSGLATINDIDIAKNPQAVKRLVGYLPEHNPLYLEMYVKEFLRYVAKLYKVAHATQRVGELVEKVGLQREQHKKISELSKGYRQRVGLAQALIHDPQVLILDEPTSGLDPNQIIEIRHVISEIGKEKTVLLSTHIMQEVEAICNRVMIIKNGKLVADGPTSELSKDQDSRFSVVLELDAMVLDTNLAKIDGVIRVKKLADSKWELIADKDIRKELFKRVVAENRIILALQQKERSLEQVFRELTN